MQSVLLCGQEFAVLRWESAVEPPCKTTAPSVMLSAGLAAAERALRSSSANKVAFCNTSVSWSNTFSAGRGGGEGAARAAEESRGGGGGGGSGLVATT
eukprot:13736751-Alexandrium_andersonii.AAC.1